MFCDDCGAKMITSRRPRLWPESGFANVVIMNGETRTCTGCGAEERAFPRLALLVDVLEKTMGSVANPAEGHLELTFVGAQWSALYVPRVR